MVGVVGYFLLDHTQRHTTVGRTPLDEGSARRRDLYLTTQHLQTTMPPAGFEPAIPAGDRPQTHALGRSAIGIGIFPTTGQELYIYLFIYTSIYT